MGMKGKYVLGAGSAIALIGGCIVIGYGADKNRHGDEAKNPLIVRKEIVCTHLAIIEKIPPDANVLNSEDVAAITVLGLYRSQEAVEALLRVISLRDNGPAGGQTPGSAHILLPNERVKYKKMLLTGRMIEEFPAAAALVDIGIPSVRAIIERIERPEEGRIEDWRLVLFARVVRKVLGDDHAREYILKEKLRGPVKAEKEYDRLLALPEMNRPVTKWRRGEVSTKPAEDPSAS